MASQSVDDFLHRQVNTKFAAKTVKATEIAAQAATEAAHAAKRSAAAAWVQAIGSIVGISIAIAVPTYQNYQEATRVAEREYASREAAWIQVRNSGVDVIDILMDSKRQLQAMGDNEQTAFQFPSWLFDDARQGIRAVPFHQIDDKALQLITDIRQVLGEVRRRLYPFDGKHLDAATREQLINLIDADLKRVADLAGEASVGSGRYPDTRKGK